MAQFIGTINDFQQRIFSCQNWYNNMLVTKSKILRSISRFSYHIRSHFTTILQQVCNTILNVLLMCSVLQSGFFLIPKEPLKTKEFILFNISGKALQWIILCTMSLTARHLRSCMHIYMLLTALYKLFKDHAFWIQASWGEVCALLIFVSYALCMGAVP